MCDGFDDVCSFGPLGSGGWATDDKAVGADWDEELVDIIRFNIVSVLHP